MPWFTGEPRGRTPDLWQLFALQIAAFLRNTLALSIGRSVGQLVKANAAGRFPSALLAIKLALVNNHIAEQPTESDR